MSAFAQRHLRLPRAASLDLRQADFLLLDMASPAACRELLLRKAVRLYAVYRVQGAVRHGVVRSGAAAVEALCQAAQQSVRGHSRATQILAGLWA